MNLEVMIEIPKGSSIKYEWDKRKKRVRVDRVLNQPTPYSYGFCVNSSAGDGDPLDVFVVSSEPIAPGTLLTVVPKFLLRGVDGGLQDDKVVGYILGDTPVEPYAGDKIRKYLSSYKKSYILGETVIGKEMEDIISSNLT